MSDKKVGRTRSTFMPLSYDIYQHVCKGETVKITKEHIDLLKNNQNFITDLIFLSLFSDDFNVSKSAYSIMIKFEPESFRFAFDNSLMFSSFSNLLSRPNVKPYVVSRIASFIIRMIANFPQYTQECTGFFSRLIPFINNTNVFDLFNEAYNRESDLNLLQELLQQVNLAPHIISALGEETNNEKIYYLLKLISIGAKNSKFKTQFRIKGAFDNLNNLFSKSTSKNINDAKFAALVSLTSRTTYMYFQYILPQVMQEIKNDTLTPSILYALRFLKKLIKYNSPLIRDFIPSVKKNVFRLITFYPDHSLISNASFQILRVGIMWDEYSETFLQEVLPFLLSQALEKTRSASSANCLKLLLDLERQRSITPFLDKLLSKDPDFEQFQQYYFIKYDNILSKPYGGPVDYTKPSVVADSW